MAKKKKNEERKYLASLSSALIGFYDFTTLAVATRENDSARTDTNRRTVQSVAEGPSSFISKNVISSLAEAHASNAHLNVSL